MVLTHFHWYLFLFVEKRKSVLFYCLDPQINALSFLVAIYERHSRNANTVALCGGIFIYFFLMYSLDLKINPIILQRKK